MDVAPPPPPPPPAPQGEGVVCTREQPWGGDSGARPSLWSEAAEASSSTLLAAPTASASDLGRRKRKEKTSEVGVVRPVGSFQARPLEI